MIMGTITTENIEIRRGSRSVKIITRTNKKE
jgi:hypothetical protein